jgi:hypothetical protein
MARIRTIKPEMAADRKLAGVSREARYTFVLLITQADDDGLVLGSPRQLLGQLYPHDEAVGLARLSRELRELVESGFVRWRETVDDAPVLEIINWSKHQRIDHKAKSLVLPMLKPVSREPREDHAKGSRESRAPTLDHGPTTNDHGPTTSTGFAECWDAYPKRAGGNSRSAAEKAYRSRIAAGATAEQLLAGTRRYAAFIRATDREGTEYVKQASTFFGPGEHYLEPWAPPTNGHRNGRHAARRSRNLEVLAASVKEVGHG